MLVGMDGRPLIGDNVQELTESRAEHLDSGFDPTNPIVAVKSRDAFVVYETEHGEPICPDASNPRASRIAALRRAKSVGDTFQPGDIRRSSKMSETTERGLTFDELAEQTRMACLKSREEEAMYKRKADALRRRLRRGRG